ncbi:MAG: FAD-dependent oxidoreductase [Bacteroidota bacterium]
MIQLKPKEWEALGALCDTIVPPIHKKGSNADFWQSKASDLQVPQKIVELISALPALHQQKFRQLCTLISSPLLGLTWLGPLKPAHRLTAQQRQTLLLRWANSPLSDLRYGFSTFKKLSGFFFFCGQVDQKANPHWATIGYPGRLREQAGPEAKIQPILPEKDLDLDCDVLIIGSGAGGSVVAAQLAQAGQKVIVVERGPYLQAKEMNQSEEEMLARLYENRGALTSVAGNMLVLAGNCLGGGTTVNWAGAFRTPDYVLEEWAKQHGNPQFLDPAYQKGFDCIEQRCKVTHNLLRHNPQNQALVDGATALGIDTKVIPRNVVQPEGVSEDLYWKAQGWSPYGDRYGIKQSANYTFLQDATEAGAELLVHTAVDRIKIQAGEAQGAVATCHHPNGQQFKVNIRSKKVVLAAGSIQSPAILLRSGLKHPEIGRNLYLHPTTVVSGIYSHMVESWNGPMMSAVCDRFTRLDGNFGFKLETPPAHPGMMASAVNWKSGEQFKQEMLDIGRTASFIILTRDKYGGQVKLDKQKQALIRYQLHNYDKKHLLQGVGEAMRIHAAAGAERLQALHNNTMTFHASEGDLEAHIQKVQKLKWDGNRYFLASAHQMGTCRMGGSDKKHPVQPNGETREVKNLYVADGSAFPSASGANPMLSIQALAHYVGLGLVN